MTETERIRVLVVDDHAVVRAGLMALLDSEPDMRVVGVAANAAEASSAFASLKPDVTLMDLRLPNVSGIEVMAHLQAQSPGARVIMFTSYTKEEEIHEALKKGVWSYILKGAPASELLEAIRVVHSGRRYISPQIGAQVVDHLSQDDLSAREREVLQQMFEGRSNKEIGVALDISEHTVNAHVRNIMGKLGASRRTEAIATALKRGILRAD
jgi:two-component system, NarL family, response regulator